MSQEDKHSLNEAPLRHWTTLAERQGDPAALAVKNSEFFSKPEEFLGREEATKYSLTNSPNLISEAAGFLELKVKQEGDNGFSRRDFLKFSGAAMVFATAGCGLRPAEKIVPYVNQPEEITLGVANYYASAAGGAQGIGVLVKTREGRPIKIEGNPTHPLNQGKLDAKTQYEIFNLYDPDRLTGPVKMDHGVPAVIPWSTADSEIAETLKSARGRIALLTGTIHGPARNKIIADFCAAFDAKHFMYDGWSRDVAVDANEACYGTPILPTYKFDQAEYVISLESDFLGSGYSSLEWSVAFGKNRHVREGKLSKLVCFDSFTSQTSANADERFRLKPGESLKAALAIADELLRTHRREVEPSVQSFTSRFSAGQVETELHLPAGSIARIAHELGLHAGKSIVIAGESFELQVVACLLNSILGNDGVTVDGVAQPSNQARGSVQDITKLLYSLNGGDFDVLITFGTNPAYSLHDAFGVKDSFAKAKTVIHLGDRADETGRLATYLMPGLHWLEGWGDAEPVKGLYSVIQPTVQPLHDCRAAEESLLDVCAGRASGRAGRV
jgi:anaerobic selenocysteine-containing dehydrogenase